MGELEVVRRVARIDTFLCVRCVSSLRSHAYRLIAIVLIVAAAMVTFVFSFSQ